MAFYAGINTVLKDSTEPDPGLEETIAATAKRIKMLEATIPAVTIWKKLKTGQNITNYDIDKIIDDQVEIRQRNGDRRYANIDLSQNQTELNEVDSMRKLEYLMQQEKLIRKRIEEVERKEQAYKNVLENVITKNVKPCLQTLKNLPPKLKNICDCKKCECYICMQKNDFLAAGQKFEEEKDKRINLFQQQQRDKFENAIKQEEEMKLKEFETRKRLKDGTNGYVCIDTCWRKNIEEIAFKLSTSLNGIMKNHPNVHNSLIEQLKEVTTTVSAAAKIIKLREKHRPNETLLNTVSAHDRLTMKSAPDPHLCAIIDYAREKQFCEVKPQPPPPPNFCRLCDRENCLHISPCCKSDSKVLLEQCVIGTKSSGGKKSCVNIKSSCRIPKPCGSTKSSCGQKTNLGLCLPVKSKCSHNPPCSFIGCNESLLIRDSSKFHKTTNATNSVANKFKDNPIIDGCKLSKSNFSCKADVLSCRQHSTCKIIPKCNLEPPLFLHIPCHKPSTKCLHIPKGKVSSPKCTIPPNCNLITSLYTPCFLPSTDISDQPKCIFPQTICQHTPKCNLTSKCGSKKCGKHSSRGGCGKKTPGTCVDAKNMKKACVKNKLCVGRKPCNIENKSCVLVENCCSREIETVNIGSS